MSLESDAVLALESIREARRGDNGKMHQDADAILLQLLEDLGYGAVAEKYRNVSDDCGGFWYE